MFKDSPKIKFSELMIHNSNLCQFCPSGRYFAVAVLPELFIRDGKTLDVVQCFTCKGNIDIIKWSPDSEFILCGMLKQNMIQVWSMADINWTCSIKEDAIRFVDVCWSPDSRHILTTSDHQIRITVWSLVSSSVTRIKNPQKGIHNISFRFDGKYLAVAIRQDCKDCIDIYVCGSWELLKRFETNTRLLAGIAWSPNGEAISAWESHLEECKVSFYSIDGRCLQSYSGYKDKLGIKSTIWSPTGQFFVFGSYDERVRILFERTWLICLDYEHPASISSEVIIYKASEQRDKDLCLENEHNLSLCRYKTIQKRPFAIPIAPNAYEKKYPPKFGIGTVEVSSDARYIASINDNMPTAVWIYNIEEQKIEFIVLHTQPVKCISWNPRETNLAICTGSGNLFLWTPYCCVVTAVPHKEKFVINSVKWHPMENVLILTGKGQTTFLYLS